jgi:hypothetical protein
MVVAYKSSSCSCSPHAAAVTQAWTTDPILCHGYWRTADYVVATTTARGNPKDVVPQSQQEAQDKVADYLQRTLQALPPSTVFDTGRYSGTGHNNSCDDNFTGPGKPPTNFGTIGDITSPPEYSPTVNATLLCFPGEIARDDIAFPAVLKGVIESWLADVCPGCGGGSCLRPP